MKRNSSILINMSDTGHGCSRNCVYCNWKTSPLLPHSIPSKAVISDFVSKSEKDFITISGGGDPLWNLRKNYQRLTSLINFIKFDLGKKVRIITREVTEIPKLAHLVDYWSVSLDDIVMKYRHVLDNVNNVEFTTVLPPSTTEVIKETKNFYVKLLEMLGKDLVLRENLNSLFPLEDLEFNRTSIKVLPKKVCLEGNYLLDKVKIGYEIVPDREHIVNKLIHKSTLFGGIIKHIITQGVIPYTDIDVFINRVEVLDEIRKNFTCIKVGDGRCKPRYFVFEHKLDRSLMLHVLFDRDISDEEIQEAIMRSQLDIDRIGIINGNTFSEGSIASIVESVLDKKATNFGTDKANRLFNRNDRFLKYRAKLLSRGYDIEEIV